MNAISQNHSDFADRVARIEQQSAASVQLLFVGVDEVYVMPRGNRKPRASRGQLVFGNLLYPLSIVSAVILGAVSHMIGQVMRFHIQGLPDLKANPDIETLVQICVGIAISVVLGYGMGLGSKAFLLTSPAPQAIAFIGIEWVSGLLWFLGKTYAFVFLFVWMRGTLPRVRVDQLMDFAWKWLLPAALLNLFVTAIAIVIVT